MKNTAINSSSVFCDPGSCKAWFILRIDSFSATIICSIFCRLSLDGVPLCIRSSTNSWLSVPYKKADNRAGLRSALESQMSDIFGACGEESCGNILVITMEAAEKKVSAKKYLAGTDD